MQDASEVRVAPGGDIYVGLPGSTEPTDVATPIDGAFDQLGYLTPDGVSITPNVESEDIMAWQTISPVLTPITGMTFEVSFTMMQFNQQTLGLYFAGEDWTNESGTGKLEISSNPGSQERCLIVEWTDNQNHTYRLVMPRAQMTNREALQLVRGDSSNLGLTFKALDDNGVAGYILTDNPDLVPSS